MRDQGDRERRRAGQVDVPAVERRRNIRYDLTKTNSRLWLIHTTEAGSNLESCVVHDLSYTGMCFSTDRPLEKDTVHSFRIELRDLLDDLVLVKAQIRWVQRHGPSEWIMGAEFVESSKGWLGPDEEG